MDVQKLCGISEHAIHTAIERDDASGDDCEGPGLQFEHQHHQMSLAGDPIRLKAVFDMCHAALACGNPMPVPSRQTSRDAVDWLVAHDLAALTADGRMVLLSSAMQSVAKLSSPVLVTHPEKNQDNSAWGLRKKLSEQRWSEGNASAASACQKVFNAKNATKSYYCLLLESFQALWNPFYEVSVC